MTQLRLLTVTENRLEGRRNYLFRTTHCPKGHLKAGDNALVLNEGPWVRCRICTEEAWRRSSVKSNARRRAKRKAENDEQPQ